MEETFKSKRCLFLKTKLAVVYKQLISLNPNNVDAHIGLGDASYELEKYEEAIAAYKEAIRLNPHDSLVHHNVAKAYLKMGNRDLALEQYEILKTLDVELANDLDSIITKRSRNTQAQKAQRKAKAGGEESPHKLSFKKMVRRFWPSPG